MLWLFISVPLMVLAIAVAVVPVAWESVRFNRSVHSTHPSVPRAVSTSHSVAADAATGIAVVGVDCPVCAMRIRSTSTETLVDAVERHAWRFHGIPSAEHIAESARVA